MSRNCTSINRSEPCGRHWFEVHGEREVLVRLTLRRIVKGRTRDLQQSALPADRQVQMVAFDHAAPHFPPQGFSFLSKKELATASSPILACRSLT